MSRAPRSVLLVAFLVLFATAAAAQNFSVGVDVQNPSVTPGSGEPTQFNISVTNTADKQKRFTIHYTVSKPSWYFLPRYTLTVPPGETRHSILYAEPDEEATEGNIGIILTVSSAGERITLRPSYRVVRDSDIIITGMETDRTVYDPASSVNATLQIKNVRQRELSANAYRAVFRLAGERKTVTIPSLIASEPETIETSFRLGRYVSGVKTLSATVERIDGVVQDRSTATIKVAEKERIVEERETKSGILASTTTVTVRNEGNTAAGDVSVSTELPFYLAWFATFTPEPSHSERTDGRIVYEWDVGRLEPGEVGAVRHRVNFWVPVVLILLVLTALGLAAREYRKPHIVKRVYRKDGTHSVHLRVENRSGKALEDVVVNDFVPSICSLVEKFDASPPEKIREGGEMTELEWELGRLEPGEERILTYSISSQVVVEGEVTLPSAHMEYDRGGKQRKRHSHPARADFR